MWNCRQTTAPRSPLPRHEYATYSYEITYSMISHVVSSDCKVVYQVDSSPESF